MSSTDQYLGNPNLKKANTALDFTPEEVKLALMGLWFKMNDKIQRLKQLVIHNQEPENESLMDSFMDLANYALIAQLVKKQVWGK